MKEFLKEGLTKIILLIVTIILLVVTIKREWTELTYFMIVLAVINIFMLLITILSLYKKNRVASLSPEERENAMANSISSHNAKDSED
ncbi:hypothetical protein [Guggenheimella bovis]